MKKLIAERLHTKFCRFLLFVNRKATSAAVRAELGRRPILTELICHSVKYWLSLCKSNPSSLVYKAYLESYSLDAAGTNTQSWAHHIKHICYHFNMSETWLNQGTLGITKCIRNLRLNIHEQYDDNWRQYMERDDSKLRTYKTFKLGVYMENYLVALKSPKLRREFTKLRISAHRLNIELGRYTRPKTPVENRKCDFCKLSVEDESHFVLDCPLVKTEREILFQQLEQFTNFTSLSHLEKFVYIMSYNDGDTEILNLVVKFINTAVEKRNKFIETGVPL